MYETSLPTNGTTVETSTRCLSDAGVLLDSRNSSVAHDAHRGPINNYAELSLNGSSLHCMDCNGATPELIVQNMHAEFAAHQRRFGEEMQHFERRMQKMADELSHLHDGWWRR